MSDPYQELANYKKYKESKSCYLDGRYFNLVFQNYPGLIVNPLYINIDENMNVTVMMANSIILSDYVGLLRVIVTAPNIRHSLLVVLDHEKKHAWIYDPDFHSRPDFHVMVIDSIISYVRNFNGFEDYEFSEMVVDSPEEEPVPGCNISGSCNGLVILFAYRLLNEEEFTDDDVKNIRKFMSAVEENYKLPLGGSVEIAYDWNNKQILGSAIGAGVGLGVGTAAFGLPAGLLLGGTLGLAGYGIGSIV